MKKLTGFLISIGLIFLIYSSLENTLEEIMFFIIFLTIILPILIFYLKSLLLDSVRKFTYEEQKQKKVLDRQKNFNEKYPDYE